ncbi:MAG: TIGR04165 family Cys-rich peptide [Methanobacteriaceae archaeon]|jgi:Cys-rich peptide (TIGR04165 family)
MKAEKLAQECPSCGCTDKTISRKRIPSHSEPNKVIVDECYIMHIPEGPVGVISCSECKHIFEYCKDRKMPIEVKKLHI